MIVDKLKGHDIDTDIKHVYTPSMATASYILNQNKTAKPKLAYILLGKLVYGVNF